MKKFDKKYQVEADIMVGNKITHDVCEIEADRELDAKKGMVDHIEEKFGEKAINNFTMTSVVAKEVD